MASLFQAAEFQQCQPVPSEIKRTKAGSCLKGPHRLTGRLSGDEPVLTSLTGTTGQGSDMSRALNGPHHVGGGQKLCIEAPFPGVFSGKGVKGN